MRKDIVFLPSKGMSLDELRESSCFLTLTKLPTHIEVLAERLLGSTKYQGFPVVKSRNDLTLLGDISRKDLKIAIGSFFTHPLYSPGR